MRISDWSSDVCSSDLHQARLSPRFRAHSPPFPRDCVAEHAGSPPASPEHAADHAHVSGPRRRTRQGRDRREARSRSSRSAAQQVFSLNKFTTLIRDEIRDGVAPAAILAAMADATVTPLTPFSELSELPPSKLTHFFQPRPTHTLAKFL